MTTLDLKSMVGFFDTLDEPEEMLDERSASLKQLGDVFEFPSYRYSSFVKMPLPEIVLERITTEPDCTVKVDADEEIAVQHKVTEDTYSRHIAMSKVPEKDATDTLHTAFMNNILVISIPDGHIARQPITIEVEAGKDTLFSSIYIRAGKDSSSRIVVKRRSSDDCSLSSTRLNLSLRAGARADLIDVQDLSHETIALEHSVFRMEDSASLTASGICLGAKYAKPRFSSELDGEGASSELRVLNLATGRRRHNIHAESLHNAPGTYSDIFTKAVVSDRAKCLATGNVYIGPEASDSNGYETQNALIISETAEADAIPNLEIRNHDVKCSHGSTVSQLDTDQIFYLMSRGMTRKNAELMLIRGFFDDLLTKVGDEDITRSAEDKIRAMLSREHGEDDAKGQDERRGSADA